MSRPKPYPGANGLSLLCHCFLMQLDHVAYAVTNAELADTVQRLGAELGVAFIDGGKHPRAHRPQGAGPAGAARQPVVCPLLAQPAAGPLYGPVSLGAAQRGDVDLARRAAE